MKVIDGLKTYICVAIVLLVLAARGLHAIDTTTMLAGMGVFGSLAIAALRHSNTKVGEQLADLLEKVNQKPTLPPN